MQHWKLPTPTLGVSLLAIALCLLILKCVYDIRLNTEALRCAMQCLGKRYAVAWTEND